MRESRRLLGATGIAVAVVLGGCSDGSENVAWMNDFCGELGKLESLSNIQPPEIAPGDVAGAQRAISDVLGRFGSTVSSTLEGLRSLPPAPEPAGDQAKQQLVDTFAPIKQQVAEAKATLDAAGPNDTGAILDVGQTMTSIGTSLQQVDNPLASLDDSAELTEAAQEAPNCKGIAPGT